jgi:UDP-glucuronate decarboxylase
MQRLKFQTEFARAMQESAAPVVITGAGGWLGQAAVEMFADALGDDIATRLHAFAARPRPMPLRCGRTLALQPLEHLAALKLQNPLVFHLAFLTREHAATLGWPRYIAENRKISAIMQDFLKKTGAGGLFVPSSGAACTADENPYGALKREDEEIFIQLAGRQNFPAVIMRVFNLSGSFINKHASYALSCIIADIARGGPVRLRAAHPVWRGYTHVQDVLNIALGCLLTPLHPKIFNSAGEPIEIGDLAERAARVLAGKKIEIQRPDWQTGPTDKYLGDATIFQNLAAQLNIRLHSLDAQILHTADYMQALP